MAFIGSMKTPWSKGTAADGDLFKEEFQQIYDNFNEIVAPEGGTNVLVKTDTITEKTADHGVNIEGVNVKDGNIIVNNGQLQSIVATGTAPISVVSTTKVNNLNADLLDGYNTSQSDTATTVVVRNASGNVIGNALQSTVSSGTAPLIVASTTKVDNLNADLLDGYNTSQSDTATTVVVRNASGNIIGNALQSTASSGTAPLIVASTTKVENLNADLLDGYNTSQAGTASTVAVRDTNGNVIGNALQSTVSSGTAPLIVASTTKVNNLNADLLDDAQKSTDTGLSSNSDNNVPSEKAVKAYVDNQIAGHDSQHDDRFVQLTTDQTIAGIKTFSSTISGSISGNAGSVTNGVYTTGNQTIAGIKTFSEITKFTKGRQGAGRLHGSPITFSAIFNILKDTIPNINDWMPINAIYINKEVPWAGAINVYNTAFRTSPTVITLFGAGMGVSLFENEWINTADLVNMQITDSAAYIYTFTLSF